MDVMCADVWYHIIHTHIMCTYVSKYGRMYMCRCICNTRIPFLRLLSDSPAILLMISGPLMRKKKAPVSLATALAMRVFPVPGGP